LVPTWSPHVYVCSRIADWRCGRASHDDCTHRRQLGGVPRLVAVAGDTARIFGFAATPYVFTVLAIAEFIVDQLPNTASRTVPIQFGARLVSGGLSGAAIGAAHGGWVGGVIAGLVGAVIGTLGGARARGAMSRAFGRDRPAALVEDAVAVVAAALIVMAVQ